MASSSFKHIVCAIRGRPTHWNTVEHAIDLALDHEARLTFLLVLQADFLGSATPALRPLSVVYDQLRDVGEFSMLALCDQAKSKGIDQVNYVIRMGEVRKNLLEYASETHADVLVLGKPMPDEPRSIFGKGEFESFVERLGRIGDIEVVVVNAEAKG